MQLLPQPKGWRQKHPNKRLERVIYLELDIII